MTFEHKLAEALDWDDQDDDVQGTLFTGRDDYNTVLHYPEYSGRRYTWYKWRAGKDWRIQAKEGWLAVGDKIVPGFVSSSLDEMCRIHLGMAFNWADGPANDIYLVSGQVVYDSTVKTKRANSLTHWHEQIHIPAGRYAYLNRPDYSDWVILDSVPIESMLMVKEPQDGTGKRVMLLDQHGKVAFETAYGS